MSNAADKKQTGAVQTTGHAWDGDLQEYNNPLPRWWVWAFYGTVVFAVVYWFLYPAWPVGTSFTKGFDTVTYEVKQDGKEVKKTVPWNTRARLMYEDEYGAEAEKQRAYLKKIEGSSYAQILSNPDMMAFVRSYAKTLFGDNCAVCHQAGGTGVVGHYPNLADDSWLWGGTVREIQHTITAGHHGFMPSFRPTFSDAQAHDVAEYVLSLSGTKGGDEKAIMRGEKIFHGQEGGCYYCHGEKATGLISQGSANLTDHVWTIANVPAAKTYDEKVAAVEHVILHGVSRVMPTWQGRLSSTQIKLLTVYVHELGGGQ